MLSYHILRQRRHSLRSNANTKPKVRGMSLDQSTLSPNISMEVAASSSALYTTLNAAAPFHFALLFCSWTTARSETFGLRSYGSDLLSLPSRRGCAGPARRSEKRPERRLYQELVALLIQTFQAQRWLADGTIYLTLMFSKYLVEPSQTIRVTRWQLRLSFLLRSPTFTRLARCAVAPNYSAS